MDRRSGPYLLHLWYRARATRDGDTSASNASLPDAELIRDASDVPTPPTVEFHLP